MLLDRCNALSCPAEYLRDKLKTWSVRAYASASSFCFLFMLPLHPSTSSSCFRSILPLLLHPSASTSCFRFILPLLLLLYTSASASALYFRLCLMLLLTLHTSSSCFCFMLLLHNSASISCFCFPFLLLQHVLHASASCFFNSTSCFCNFHFILPLHTSTSASPAC